MLPPVRLSIDSDRRLLVQRSAAATYTPEVLFDAGAFGIYVDGTWLASELSRKGLPTVLYSRAGLWGSDPVPKGERPDPFFHAADMARLLDRLEVTAPVVLIGHSMAGLRLRAFAALWPERVRALVFVDAVPPSALDGVMLRKLVRAGCRLAGAAGSMAESPLGRRVMALYPNNIGLEGQARVAKAHSLTSAAHLAGTRAEMLASTSPDLARKLSRPLPGCPALAVTATPVARGTSLEAIRTHHIYGVGHAGILAHGPAETIADLTLDLLERG